jgi:predicted amidohydrolase YtcJ
MLECPLQAERRAETPPRPEDFMAARLTTYVVVGIVAATLIAGLIVGAQRDDSDGPVDLIVFNAKVYTADASGTTAEAVAIRGNQILRVGSNREINRLRRPRTVLLDALGAAVLPGFNDANVEFISGGLGLDAIDLVEAMDVDEIQARIRTWADANPDRTWVVGRGWSAESFQSGGPTRVLLDAAVPNRPAYVLSNDGRSAWVNTRALRLAGITRKTSNPAGGVIVKDARTGEPTGVLKGAAVALAGRLVPRPTHDERARALRAAIVEAHRNGITSVQDAAAGAEDLALYEEARRAGDLKVRVYASMALEGAPTEREIEALDAVSSEYPDDPMFKAGSVRIALDGPIESCEAAMLEPCNSTPGVPARDPAVSADDLNRTARLLDARGWQITATATGDRAARMALDAYEHAVRSNPRPQHERRNRLEHAAFIADADLPRLARLNVIASFEPLQAAPIQARIDALMRSVGSERSSRAWPYASIAAAAGPVAFGTGWPAAPMNPMAAIHIAVNRTTVEGLPEGGWNPAERLPLKRAIDAFTSGPAYASFDEQRKGSLKVGMLADLVVLSTDIFDGPPSRLASTTVAVTIFDGKIVYRHSAKSTN